MLRDTKKASLKQERQVAAAEKDGRVNPGSGNGWRFKNDVRSPDFSFECKTTAKTFYSLKKSELDTAATHALADCKEMVFVNDIDGKRYYTVHQFTWEALVPEESRDGFLFEHHSTDRKSARLDRADLDDLEVVALYQDQEPIMVNVIQGERYYTMRDYTWQAIRGD